MKLSLLWKKYKDMTPPVKASLWYTVCNVLNKSIALLSLPIFTRILTEQQYGSFSIFQSWYNIILIFTSLNISIGSFSKGLLRFEEDRERFTSSLMGLSVTLTAIWFIVYLAMPQFWNGVFELNTVLMLAMFVRLFTMPAMDLWATKKRFDYHYKKYVLISILQSALSVGLGVVAIALTEHKLEARVFTDVFSKVIFGLPLLVLLFCRGKTFFHKEYWKYALAFNIPLLPHFLSHYVLTQSDRVMIGKMAGDSQAAYYSVAYTISTVIVLIVNAVNSSLTPYIYKKIHSGNSRDIKKSMNPIILLIAVLCVLTMVFAPEIITIFAGVHYADAIYVVPPVAASVYFIFIYGLFSTVEYYHQKTVRIAAATAIAAAINIVLNFIFIPMAGYHAAGYTTLASYIVLSITHYIFYRVIIKKSGDAPMFDERFIVLISAAVLMIMGVMALTYQTIIVRYVVAGALVIAGILLRKKIMEILRFVKKS